MVSFEITVLVGWSRSRVALADPLLLLVQFIYRVVGTLTDQHMSEREWQQWSSEYMRRTVESLNSVENQHRSDIEVIAFEQDE